MEEQMKQIIKLFKENGYQLWQVGGSVRDEIMGKEPNDIDFATDANPIEMMKLNEKKIGMKDITVWASENGKLHGTVVFQEDGVDYEVTTFRKDVSCDGRNATVEWSDTIEEDLSRRDLTMNAIAKNMYTGEYVDPFDGQKDIENKYIRFVGKAENRIREDRLRLFRAYRFLSQMGRGWQIVDEIPVQSELDLRVLSKERIRDEIVKIFKYNPVFALYNMPIWVKSHIFDPRIFINRDGGKFHAEDTYLHGILSLMNAVRLSPDPLFRLAVFLHDCGKHEPEIDENWNNTYPKHMKIGADMVEEWMKEMKFSNKEIDYVKRLVRYHMVSFQLFEPDVTDRQIKRFVVRIGEDLLDDMIMLNFCDRMANMSVTMMQQDYDEFVLRYSILPRWQEIKRKDNCFKITDLKVNGHDIMKKGYEGKEIGEKLKELFEKVENKELENKKEDLLKAIKNKNGN